MKAYPSYVQSGLIWMGIIPKHWELRRFKFLSVVSKKRNDDDIDRQMLSVSQYHGIVPKEYEFEIQKRSKEDSLTYLVVEENQLVLNTMWLNYGGIGVSKLSGIVSPAYRVYDLAKDLYPRFAHYLFRSASYIDEYTRLAYGIRPNSLQVSVEGFGNLLTPLPPLPEQQAIADFLDRKTAQIDTLIEKKQQQIDLLQEQRTALINHAVTKGLNPDVHMKDSGVEWLGEIPSHWDMVRLRHISPTISVGLVIQPTQYVDEDGTVPFLYGSNIRENSFLLDDVRKISPESSQKLNTSMLHTGDLVTVRVGYPGVTAVIPPFLEGANCASMMIVRKSDFVLSEFLCYTMNSRVGMLQVGAVQYGAAQKQFNISHAVDFIYPIPPLEEQQIIVDYLEGKSQGIYRLISILQKQIEMLQEYRTALISEAVTGKIDVRTAV